MPDHASAIRFSAAITGHTCGRTVVNLIMAFVVACSLVGCSSGNRSGDDSSLARTSPNRREPIVYIRGKAVEYGTGRTIANPPPPRKSTAEEELLEETRRKSDVTIWAAVAGPEGKVVWVPVRKPTK